jgi:hypothetical protein
VRESIDRRLEHEIGMLMANAAVLALFEEQLDLDLDLVLQSDVHLRRNANLWLEVA